jgi:hypothetical protein
MKNSDAINEYSRNEYRELALALVLLTLLILSVI